MKEVFILEWVEDASDPDNPAHEILGVFELAVDAKKSAETHAQVSALAWQLLERATVWVADHAHGVCRSVYSITKFPVHRKN